MLYRCNEPDCSHTFASENGLRKHKRNKHTVEKQVKLTVKCPADECTEAFATHDQMVAHMNDHHQNIVIIHREFASVKQFDAFKQTEERLQVCRFVTYKSGEHSNTFNCSRSGQPRLIATEDRKNARSNLNTKKCGKTCPARMTIKIDKLSGEVKLKYVQTHYGHEMDEHMIPLRDEQRQEIQDLLSKGLKPEARG